MPKDDSAVGSAGGGTDGLALASILGIRIPPLPGAPTAGLLPGELLSSGLPPSRLPATWPVAWSEELGVSDSAVNGLSTVGGVRERWLHW